MTLAPFNPGGAVGTQDVPDREVRLPGVRPSVVACHIDGDFFIDGGDEDDAYELLSQTQQALIKGQDIQAVFDRFPHVRFTGVDAHGVQTAFDRAVNRAMDAVDESVQSAPQIAPKSSKSAAQRPESYDAQDSRIEHEWLRRWPTLHLNVVHDKPRDPAEQMTLDEQWAREVASGQRRPTLRMWEWSAPTVVIGRFQSLYDEVNLKQAKREGVSVVRRCTGGGAMFIEPGNTITYSLYAPMSFVEGFTVAESYRLCDQWLVRALSGLGLNVRFSGLNDIASQHGKIGGAAQRRFPPVGQGSGSVLHHVTLAYDIDAEKMGRILNVSQVKLSDKAVRSAIRRVDPMRSQTGKSRVEVISHLLAEAKRLSNTPASVN